LSHVVISTEEINTLTCISNWDLVGVGLWSKRDEQCKQRICILIARWFCQSNTNSHNPIAFRYD